MTESIGAALPSNAHEPLRGFGGWLAFAFAVLCFFTVGYGWVAYMIFANGATSEEAQITGIVLGVFVAVTAFTALSLWREKKYARWLAVVVFCLLFLQALFNLLVSEREMLMWLWAAGRDVALSLGLAGYFIRSERVKNTLVN